MNTIQLTAFVGASLLATSLSAVAPLAKQASQAHEPVVAGQGQIIVPEGDGAPVITDGVFTPGEWDDAKWIDLNKVVRLYFKQYRGVVFLGIRGAGTNQIGPSALSIAPPGAPIHLLHVSAQLGEVILPGTGDAPPFRFGLTTDWYANEQRRDMEKAAILQKEGKNPIEIITETTYPSDGIEFAIRRSKFPGACWSVRLEISFLEEQKPNWMVYPAESPERTTEGWLSLCFD